MVDVYAKKLVKKMHNFAPDFAINTCYRSVKIKNINAYTYKPKTEIMDTANCIYHFQCDCDSNYIGQSKRKVKVRIGEHFKGEAISDHIKYCKVYKSNLKYFKKPTDENVTVEQLWK